MVYLTKWGSLQWHGQIHGREQLVLSDGQLGPYTIRLPRAILAEIISQEAAGLDTQILRRSMAKEYGPTQAHLATPWLIKEMQRPLPIPADWWVFIPEWWPDPLPADARATTFA